MTVLQVGSPAHLPSHGMWESSLQAANRHNSRNFFPWDYLKGMHMFNQVGMMKGAQSSTSNISFPFLIQRSLGPEEGDFKLWIVEL